MAYLFLTLEEVVAIHRNQIELYGGTHGIRDFGLLRSALAMPSAGFGDVFLHADIFEMAAAYLFHLLQNHPFLDGNKRTAAASAIVFFMLNDITIEPDQDSYEKLVRSVLEGKTKKEDIVNYFRQKAKNL